MPVRNAGQWLQTAVSSILANAAALQLVLVDDGSTDGAVDDLVRAGLPDHAVVLRPGRVGLAGALQLGLEQASAPWLSSCQRRCCNGAITTAASPAPIHDASGPTSSP